MRMVSGLTRNQLPENRLRVRIPCPPLDSKLFIETPQFNYEGFFQLFCFVRKRFLIFSHSVLLMVISR